MTDPDPAQVLECLTRRQREVLIARLGPGGTVVPQGTIAVRFGITQSAVSQRMWNGIRRLRRTVPADKVEALLARLALN